MYVNVDMDSCNNLSWNRDLIYSRHSLGDCVSVSSVHGSTRTSLSTLSLVFVWSINPHAQLSWEHVWGSSQWRWPPNVDSSEAERQMFVLPGPPGILGHYSCSYYLVSAQSLQHRAATYPLPPQTLKHIHYYFDRSWHTWSLGSQHNSSPLPNWKATTVVFMEGMWFNALIMPRSANGAKLCTD